MSFVWAPTSCLCSCNDRNSVGGLPWSDVAASVRMNAKSQFLEGLVNI